MLYVKTRSSGFLRPCCARLRPPAIYGGPMRVLLTGGSGFLGSFTAEQLAADGHVGPGLVRPRSDKRVLEKLPGWSSLPAPSKRPDSLLTAAENVDAVVHVAGIVKHRKPDDFFQVNAQERATSSRRPSERTVCPTVRLRVLPGKTPSGRGLDGNSNPGTTPSPRPVTHYGRSKLEGGARRAGRRKRTIRLHRDRVAPAAESTGRANARRSRSSPPCATGYCRYRRRESNTLSVVYVADCAAAIVRALGADGAPRAGRTSSTTARGVRWAGRGSRRRERARERAFVRFACPWACRKVAAAGHAALGKVT